MNVPAGQLALFEAEDDIVVRRSARARRLALKVFPHGAVEVVAPLRASQLSIEHFVRSNAAWIAKSRGYFLARVGDAGFAPPAQIRLLALDECWQVEYVTGNKHLRVLAEPGGGRLILCGPPDPQWRRQRLRDWLLARGRESLLPWLASVSAEAGLPYGGATVRRQRSRWGSCSARRMISLNCALLFLEPTLVRHLFLHELAHTRHLNHSRAFWRLVATLEPEFESMEHGLSEAWCRVPAWVTYDSR